jgi:serine/threonine protein kinase
MTDHESTRSALSRMFGDLRAGSYTQIEYYDQGGARDVFKVRWGPSAEERAIKVDRTPENPRAVRYAARGCTTSNELEQASKIRHPGVTGLLDYFTEDQTRKYGLPGTIVVGEFFPNSTSLQKYVSEHGALTGGLFRDVFSQVVATEYDIIKGRGVSTGESMFHRDIKASNILVQIIDGIAKAKITDWANACRASTLRTDFLPTAGSRDFTDPLIMGPFTGENSRYNIQAELYGLASTMAFAIRGRPIFQYDADRREAKVWDTGRSLLDNRGKIIKERHQEALEEALRRFPREFKRYIPIIRRAMNLEEGLRYDSIDEFASDFQRAAQYNPRRRWAIAGLSTLGALALTGVGALFYHSENAKRKLQEQRESERIERTFEHRQENIRTYQVEKHKSGVEYYLARNIVQCWIDKFDGDERMGFAAYLNADKVYEIIQEAGGKQDWESIKPLLKQKDYDLFVTVNSLYEPYPTDLGISGGGSRAFKPQIESDWNSAALRYREKQATKAALTNFSNLSPSSSR